MPIRYILCSFGTFFPVLVSWAKKNLATLERRIHFENKRTVFESYDFWIYYYIYMYVQRQRCSRTERFQSGMLIGALSFFTTPALQPTIVGLAPGQKIIF
jgi:hypothetical protein